jgi:hypothetical protein
MKLPSSLKLHIPCAQEAAAAAPTSATLGTPSALDLSAAICACSVRNVFLRTAVVSVALAFACVTALAAQAPSGEPEYVVRGKQTEVHQREFAERLGRLYDAVAAALKRDAPDLLPTLDPPPSPPGVFGYQILPRILPDRPQPPPAKPQVVSYSWGWSDTLFAQNTAEVVRLEAELARVSTSGVDRAAYQALVAAYHKAVDRRRRVDADVAYNWLWQAAIAANRPGFDIITRRLEAAVERQAIEAALAAQDDAGLRAARGIKAIDFTQSGEQLRAALVGRAALLTREIDAGMDEITPPAFVHIEHSSDHEWVVSVSLTTDIMDAGFVEAFKTAIESVWHVRSGPDEFRVRLDIAVLTPEQLYCGQADEAKPRAADCVPPVKGDHIDLAAHGARFPKDAAVLTTGAPSLRVLVVSPYDVTPRVLAHEFGHLLGFPDAYFRGYRDLGADGFQIMELVPNQSDLMAAPGLGAVFARHFEALIAARGVQK